MGLAVVWIALVVNSVYGGHLTGLFFHGQPFPVPPELNSIPLYVHPNAGYDGQFYRMVAHDPFLTRGFWAYMDSASLRASRVLVPFAAWLLGAGNDRAIDVAYIAIQVLSIGIGVFVTGLLARLHTRSTWWAVSYLLAPVVWLSLERQLLDGPFLALTCAWIWAVTTGRWGIATVMAASAALCRETGVILVGALGLAALLDRQWRRAAFAVLSILPSLAWLMYTRAMLPLQDSLAATNLGYRGGRWNPPLQSIIKRFWNWPEFPGLNPEWQMPQHVTELFAVAGVLFAVLYAFRAAVKWPRDPVALAAAGFALLAALLPSWRFFAEFYGFGRSFAPLLFLVMILGWRTQPRIAAIPTGLQYPRFLLEAGGSAWRALQLLRF